MALADLQREKERRRRATAVIPDDIPQPEAQAVPQGPSFGSEAGAVAQQFNASLANILGIPVNLVNEALRMAGASVSEQPFAGTESIEAGLQAAGAITEPGGRQPETTVGRFAGAGAREFAASAVPFGAAVKFAPQIAKAASPFVSKIGQQIAAKPLQASIAEAGASALAGVGGETARTLLPGSEAAELAATTLTPAAASLATSPFRAAIRGVGQGGQVARTAREFAQAGVQPTAADVAQSGAARGVRSTLQKIPGAAGRVNREITRVSDEFSQTVNTLVGTDPVSAERAGRVIRRGLVGESGFVTRFQKRGGDLYDKITPKIGEQSQVSVNRTAQILDELANPVVGAPATSAVLANEKITNIGQALLQDAVQDGDNLTLPFSALKAVRSRIGQMISSNDIVSDAPRAELKRIYAAITEDMGDAAANAGATREFKQANQFWKAGMKRIDDQLQNIARKVNDEDVFLQSTRGKEGAGRIRAVRRSVTPEEWDVSAKTVLRRFGKLPPGQQDAFGEGFSVERWLTDINKLSPEARDAIFGGTDLAAPMRNLQKIANEIKVAQRVGINVSGTAQGTAGLAIAGSVGASIASGDITPALIAGTTVLGANRTAALMSSPAFVKWLAGSAQIAPERLPGYIGRLANIGANDPELAGPLAEYTAILQEELQ